MVETDYLVIWWLQICFIAFLLFDSRENVENSENNEQTAPNRQVFIDIRIGDPYQTGQAINNAVPMIYTEIQIVWVRS